MKALILAGGFGTRLQPLTLRIPKVMVPVAGKPVIAHLIEICRTAKIEEVVISLNSAQKAIENYFGDGLKFGVKIAYVYEQAARDEDKMGAIGAISHVLSQVDASGDWLIIGGDNIFYGLDLARLSAAHASSGASATLALYQLKDKRDCEQYGVVQLGAGGRIIKMQEKPKTEEAVSSLACAAVYAVGEAFLKEYLPKFVQEAKAQGKKADRLGDLWAKYASQAPIYGHAFEGMWGDANTPKTYIETNKQAMAFAKGDCSELECRIIDRQTVKAAPGANVHPDATIKGPCIIEDGVTIGAGAVVGHGTHLMKGAKVGENAFVSGSIIFNNASIGANARVIDSVVDMAAKVGISAQIEPYSLIGFQSKIGEGAKILQETRVWPFVEIGANSIASGDFTLPEVLIAGRLDKS